MKMKTIWTVEVHAYAPELNKVHWLRIPMPEWRKLMRIKKSEVPDQQTVRRIMHELYRVASLPMPGENKRGYVRQAILGKAKPGICVRVEVRYEDEALQWLNQTISGYVPWGQQGVLTLAATLAERRRYHNAGLRSVKARVFV